MNALLMMTTTVHMNVSLIMTTTLKLTRVYHISIYTPKQWNLTLDIRVLFEAEQHEIVLMTVWRRLQLLSPTVDFHSETFYCMWNNCQITTSDG